MNYKEVEYSAEESLEAVAKKNGVSIEAVKREINSAIAIARENSDPKVQAFWDSVPHKGKAPTPEEVIAYIAAMGHGIPH